MLCPWCMHYGAEDDEYVFDDELYCGICAQQMPDSDARWAEAVGAMTADMLGHVEEELNKIAVSKSGLQPALRDAMGQGIAALAALRLSLSESRSLPRDAEHVRWARFACTYYAPQLR